jgi:hypothetical protein
MKAGLISVFIFVFLIILILSGSLIRITKSAIDIHISDTYFIINNWWTLLIPFFLALLFIFGITASIASKFKNRLYNQFLLTGIFGLISYFVYYILLFSKS